jgi:hypothetical protein
LALNQARSRPRFTDRARKRGAFTLTIPANVDSRDRTRLQNLWRVAPYPAEETSHPAHGRSRRIASSQQLFCCANHDAGPQGFPDIQHSGTAFPDICGLLQLEFEMWSLRPEKQQMPTPPARGHFLTSAHASRSCAHDPADPLIRPCQTLQARASNVRARCGQSVEKKKR